MLRPPLSPQPTSTSPDNDAADERRLRALLHDASHDAPRADLWPRLEGAVRARAAARPRWWRRLDLAGRARRVALASAALVAIAALLAGLWAFFRARSAAIAATGAVPDTIFVSTYDKQEQGNDIAVLRAGARQLQPLLTGAGAPAVSPDGRQLVFVQGVHDGDTVRTNLVAVSSDTFARDWSVPLDARPAAVARTSWLLMSVAITADDVYVGSGHLGDPQVTITAYDRDGGRQRARWEVAPGLPGQIPSSVALYAAPDAGGGAGRQLLVQMRLVAASSPTAPPTATAFFRYHLPDGRLEARVAPVEPPPGASYYGIGTRLTPDGRTLYDITYTDYARGVAISFFDVAGGTVLPPITLPFRAADLNGFLPYEQGLSHDGRTLYILAPTLGQLAIVDLADHRLVQVVPVADLAPATPGATSARPSLLGRLWGALRGLVVQDAAAKIGFQGALQLSPDGRRLYAIGTTGQGENAQAQGVLAIDTSDWRVVARWLPGVRPLALSLSGDGRALTVETWNIGQFSDAQHGLQTLDTTSGATLFTTTLPNQGTATSLADLYRETYGRSPRAGGVSPTDAAFVPVAMPVPTISPANVLAGDRVTFELRFADPATGDTVAPGERGVRYDPPAGVTATLCRADTCLPALALDPAGYGVYRGSAVVRDLGVWTVRFTARGADGAARTVTATAALTVQPAFRGTDGRRYKLAITTDPTPPVAGQWATVTAAFVDAATGAPLPAGVALADGLPAELEVDFFAPAGVTSSSLKPTGHGAYTGQVNLPAAGTWTVRVTYHTTGSGILFDAGTVEAVSR